MKPWMWLRIFFVMMCAGILQPGNGSSSGGGNKKKATVVPVFNLSGGAFTKPTVDTRPAAGDDDVVPLPDGFSFDEYAGIFSPRKPRASTFVQEDLQVLGSTLGVVLRPGVSEKEDGTPRPGATAVAGLSAPRKLERKQKFYIPVHAPVSGRRERLSSGASEDAWSTEEIGQLTSRVDAPLTFDRFYVAWREMRPLVLELKERLAYFKNLYQRAFTEAAYMDMLVVSCNEKLGQQIAETGSAGAIAFERGTDLVAEYDKAYLAYREALIVAELLCMGTVQWPVVDISGFTPNIQQRLGFLLQPACAECPAVAYGKAVGRVFDARRNEILLCSQCGENFLQRFFGSYSVAFLSEQLGVLSANVEIAMKTLFPITPGFVSKIADV